MKKFGKKFIALATACAVFMMLPATVLADDWIDGDTPSSYDNRVIDSLNNVYTPTVRTNFHAPSIRALIPYSSKSLFDKETGVSTSKYSDAYSCVYATENTGYGTLAQTALASALKTVGGTNVTTVTLNLFKYEGSTYKQVTSTADNLEFMVYIPTSVRSAARDFAMIRLNADGTISYLPDQDTDSYTVTFDTNYFGTNDLYCLVYAPKGAFNAYKTAAATTAATASNNAAAGTTTTVTTTTVTTTTKNS
jgi:hypothetical protein